MKKLIELLEAYEGISKKLNKAGYIGTLGAHPTAAILHDRI